MPQVLFRLPAGWFSVLEWRCQRRVDEPRVDAPVPLGVSVEGGLPRARVSTPTPVPAHLEPYPPTTVVAAAAVVAIAALSSVNVVSHCTIRAANSPNIKLATNSSATNVMTLGMCFEVDG